MEERGDLMAEPDKCFVCEDPATRKFFGKQLCDYHYELSKH
jgi:hypothetical protein